MNHSRLTILGACLACLVLGFPLRADILSERSVRVVESGPRGLSLNHPEIPDTFQAWQEMIDGAEEQIRIGAFYFSTEPGTRLEHLIERLIEKARSGVQVRIVTEKKFYETYPEPVDRLRDVEGIKVRLLNLNPVLQGVMHAKYMIVDQSRAYVGSANFDWRSLEHIREVGVVFNTDHLVKNLTTIFESDWEFAGLTTAEKKAWDPLQTLSLGKFSGSGFWSNSDRSARLVASAPAITPNQIQLAEPEIIRMINQAEESIFLDLYRYSPWDQMNRHYYDRVDRALRRANARGVEVKLLVSDWNLTEHQQTYLKSLGVLNGIEVKALRIPQAREGYIPYARVSHPKLMVVDGKRAWVGSSNLQWGYLRQSRTVDVFTRDQATVRELKQFFLTAWQSRLSFTVRPTIEYEAPYKR